jgi:(E)-4-hydroxy-3-methylbut-2-enyl-diphosphate synthase
MQIKVGRFILGSDYIPVQTMIKNSVTDIDLTLSRIQRLSSIGCDIIRVAVPDEKSALCLKKIVDDSPIPIVADIHFDYKLALISIENGVHKIRINPGNIGDESNVKKVIDAAKSNNVPIRIGINCGSLPEHIIKKNPRSSKIDLMLESAREELSYFKKNHYDKIILSFKSSSVTDTIEVNRKARREFDFPLHIGITEAGDLIDGAIKNSVGLGVLLSEGIGDTIRVSLTSSEENEIITGIKILEAVGKRKSDIDIISCPTCGRTQVFIEKIVAELKSRLDYSKKPKKRLKIAVMGCVVNGIGESKDADFGIACGKEQSILFKDGKKIKIIKNNQILDELLNILKGYYE